MTTRVRYLDGGDCREASRLCDDPKLKPPLRLWVEAERDGLTRLGVIAVSSDKDTTEELRRDQGHSFWVTRDDLRWFIEQLPLALAFVESEPEEKDPGPDHFRDVIGEGE